MFENIFQRLSANYSQFTQLCSAKEIARHFLTPCNCVRQYHRHRLTFLRTRRKKKEILENIVSDFYIFLPLLPAARESRGINRTHAIPAHSVPWHRNPRCKRCRTADAALRASRFARRPFLCRLLSNCVMHFSPLRECLTRIRGIGFELKLMPRKAASSCLCRAKRRHF